MAMAPSTPTTKLAASAAEESNNNNNPDLAEIGHYVVTAHPPSSVYTSIKCSFLPSSSSSSSSNNSNDVSATTDVVIAKANLLEVRRYQPPDRGLNEGEGGASSHNNKGASSSSNNEL